MVPDIAVNAAPNSLNHVVATSAASVFAINHELMLHNIDNTNGCFWASCIAN